jgi:hypothetical protein
MINTFAGDVLVGPILNAISSAFKEPSSRPSTTPAPLGEILEVLGYWAFICGLIWLVGRWT